MLLPCFAIGQSSSSSPDSLTADTTLMNQFLDLFSEEAGSSIPEVQRSRRKQVDQLLRAILEQPGKLQFSGVATASMQAELVKKNPTWLGVGSFDIFALTSFGKHALLFFDLEAIGGNGPDVIIPNHSVLNGDAGRTTAADGTDRLTILEAWTEFKVLRDIFTVTFGKIDLTNYFDNNLHANDETSQFISGVFVNNPVLPVGVNSPGIRFRTGFINRFYIQYGLAMVNPRDINLMKNHLKMLETGFKLFPESGWEANFRIFGHEHPLANHSQGFGISYDQLIANHFNIFGRYGKNKQGLAEWHGVEEAWSTGVGFRQVLFHREFKIGLAFAETLPYDQLHPERMVEVYLNNQLNNWVFVSPHFQWIETRTPETTVHFMAGLRLNFTY